MFKKISYILLGMTLMVSGTVLAAPYFTYQRTLLPETNNAFDLGTTTSVWRDLFVTQICLSGDCKTAWPAGGPGSSDGYGFTTNSYGGSTVQSTTTGLWLKALTPYSLIASSTLFTYASTTQLDVTGTATTTFGGSIVLGHPYTLTAHGLRGDASDGLYIFANNYTQVADFGVGNSANSTFYGGVNVTGNLSVLTGSTLTVADLTSALTLTGAGGIFAEYTGTSCTNQFVRSLSALGVATCATVANTDLANSSITINGSSVSLGGSITVASTTLLSDLNNWTKRQDFSNTTTSLASFSYSSSTDAYFGTGQGIAYIGSGGRLRATATSTFSLSQFTNDLANLTALDTSLTFSGSYNGSAARTVGLNTGRTNTWTVLQNFNYASVTAYFSSQVASTTDLFLGTGQGALYAGSGQAVKSVATSTQTVGASLSYSGTQGSMLGGSSGTLSLNMANTNSWTALQNFQYSSSTIYSSFLTASSTFGNIGTLTLSTTTTGCLNTSSIGIVYATTCSSFSGAANSIVTTNAAGALIATGTQLTVGNILATTTATSTFIGKMAIGSSTLGMLNGFFSITGQENNYIQNQIQNKSTGNNASSVFVASSDKATDSTYFTEFGINNSNYAQSAYSSQNAGDAFVLSSDGALNLTVASSTNSLASLRFVSGGTASTSIRAVIDYRGYMTIGTTTNTSIAPLTISSSTKPQLSLSAGTSGISQWFMRNAGGSFYLGTTTTAGTATSSVSALNIDTNGQGIWNMLKAIASLIIPNSTDPNPSTTGQIAINTTTASSSVRFYDGTAERALFDTFDKPTVYASSTLAYDGAYSGSATTTYIIWNPSHAVTLTSIYCKTDTGTVWYEVGNGSATSTVQCTTSGASSNTSVSFTLRQNVMEALGRQSSNPSRIVVTPTFRYQAD